MWTSSNQIFERTVDSAHIREQFVGEVIEEPFLDEGTGKRDEIFPSAFSFDFDDPVDVEETGGFVIVSEWRLPVHSEHFHDEIPVWASFGLAHDIQIVVGQNFHERNCHGKKSIDPP